MYRQRWIVAEVAGGEHNCANFRSTKKGPALKAGSGVSALLVACSIISFVQPIAAQKQPNANTAYRQLRGLTPGDDVVGVKDFSLTRDAAKLTFRSGSFAFYKEVNGKI